uniref:hypothetical protein n=1 Tax=Dyadobacter diqingensis TaxID=2938121 RepID=UPI0020C377BA
NTAHNYGSSVIRSLNYESEIDNRLWRFVFVDFFDASVYLNLPSQTVFYFKYAVILRNTPHNYGSSVIRSLNYESEIDNRL